MTESEYIEKLKKAIVYANSCVRAGEGVGLSYYFEEDFDVDSIKLISEIVGEDVSNIT